MTTSIKKSAILKHRELLALDFNQITSNNFFLSGGWFELYLQAWPEKSFYAAVDVGSATEPALVFLGKSIQRSKLGSKISSLYFNETGDQRLQNFTVEYNDFLSKSIDNNSVQFAQEDFTKRLALLFENIGSLEDWDELQISAIDSTFLPNIRDLCVRNGYLINVHYERTTYWADLSFGDEQKENSYLSTRSSNTRSQLRKALRTTEAALGKLNIEFAGDTETAKLWFDELGKLHRIRWNQTGDGIGFNNPVFVQFHQKLIDSMFPQSRLFIVRLSAGMTPLAFLHFFAYEKNVYFNLGGIDYQVAGANKPGLLAHWFAIEKFIEMGILKYDFMAGFSQYKQSLSTHTSDQIKVIIRKKKLTFRIESLLRSIKQYAKRNSATPVG